MYRLFICFFLIASQVFAQKVQLSLFAFSDISKVNIKEMNSLNKITVFNGNAFDLDEKQISKLNLLKIDFATFGKNVLSTQMFLIKQLFKKTNFPFVCSNLLSIDESLFISDQSMVFDFEGVRVGAFSLLNPDRSSLQKKTTDYLLISDVFASKEKIDELRKKKCDVIIAFVQGESYSALLKEQIDIIVCLDAKQSLSFYEDNTIIYHFCNNADPLSRADLLIDKNLSPKGEKVSLYPY